MSYDNMRRDWHTVTVTIASGGALSGAADLGGSRLLGIQIPPAWTAADITIAASSAAAGTYGALRDAAGTEYTITGFAVNEVVYLDPSVVSGLRYLKIRSGAVGAPVNQLADRVLTLFVRPL